MGIPRKDGYIIRRNEEERVRELIESPYFHWDYRWKQKWRDKGWELGNPNVGMVVAAGKEYWKLCVYNNFGFSDLALPFLLSPTRLHFTFFFYFIELSK